MVSLRSGFFIIGSSPKIFNLQSFVALWKATSLKELNCNNNFKNVHGCNILHFQTVSICDRNLQIL